MNAKKFFILTSLIFAAVVSGRADEKFPTLQVGGITYSNVTITGVSATDLFFTHAAGMGNAKIKSLAPELQKHFLFDPKKAQAAELKQAENKTKYHEQLLQQPAAKAPDLTRDPAAGARPAPAVWRNDFAGALKQAKSEGKLVLLDFTGSDWCPSCIQFHADVLTTEKFAAYAGKKLQLVKVDFPRRTALPEEQRHANDLLSANFRIEFFPTLVLVNGDGKELGRQVGYLNGGPDAFIAELEQFSGR